MSANAAAGSASWRSVTLAGTWAGKASGRGSTQVTAKGSGASASTSARPTWPAPKRTSGRAVVAEGFGQDVVGEGGAARRHVGVGDDRADDAVGVIVPGVTSRPDRLARGQLRDLVAAVGGDDLDDQLDIAAAALAEFGAERVVAHLGPGRAADWRAPPAPRAMARHSSVPPPMVPVKPPSGWTIRRAPASRGVEPRVAATVTMATRPWRVERLRRTRGQTGVIASATGWWRGWRA